MFSNNKTRSGNQLFMDNLIKAIAIIGVFLAAYYAYLEMPYWNMPNLAVQGNSKFVKLFLGIVAFIGYRMWLKKQGILFRLFLNVVIFGGSFFALKYYLGQMGTMEVIDFITKFKN